MNNIRKHSQAKTAEVLVEFTLSVSLKVSDNGEDSIERMQVAKMITQWIRAFQHEGTH